MNIEAKKDGTNAVTVFMDGNTGNVVAGGNGEAGSLVLKNSSGIAHIIARGGAFDLEDLVLTANITLDGEQGSISLRHITLYAPSGPGPLHESIVLNGPLGNISVGGPAGAGGNILLYPENSSATDLNDSGKAGIHLDGNNRRVHIGGNGQHGSVHLFPKDCNNIGDLSQANLQFLAETGDILLKNADCAEDFDISQSDDVDPGMVMVIDQDRLRPSTEPYDKKVAGVISGAGGFRPGIVLDRKQSKNDRFPVALLGKVYCWADADYSPIQVGDLLTTSCTPGHAMKANDPQKSFGAVIGKALRSLTTGQNLIPILIALQ